MKPKIRKILAIPLIAVAVAICSGGFSVSAAFPTEGIGDNETLNALYHGAPPVAPTVTTQPTVAPNGTGNTESQAQSMAANDTPNTIADPVKTPSPIPFDGITPQNPPRFASSVDTVPIQEPTPTAPPLYPFDVRSVEDGGTRWILKSYALANGESPDGISREAFERDGWRYELTDIVRQSNVGMVEREAQHRDNGGQRANLYTLVTDATDVADSEDAVDVMDVIGVIGVTEAANKPDEQVDESESTHINSDSISIDANNGAVLNSRRTRRIAPHSRTKTGGIGTIKQPPMLSGGYRNFIYKDKYP